jgi:hypothetical protein
MTVPRRLRRRRVVLRHRADLLLGQLPGDLVHERVVLRAPPALTLGRTDGTAHGGHLLEATVRLTLEVIVTEGPPHLRRTFDPTTGLHLIDPTR